VCEREKASVRVRERDEEGEEKEKEREREQQFLRIQKYILSVLIWFVTKSFGFLIKHTCSTCISNYIISFLYEICNLLTGASIVHVFF
jgi:hypothetical protein